MNVATSEPVTPIDLSPADVQASLANGEIVLVDVREPFERAAERIEGSASMALSSFDGKALRDKHPGQRLVFHCKGGKRSADASGRFSQANGETQVFHLAGGIEAWKAAGRPVERSASAPKIDVMRQVQMVAGGLVATGVLLGVTVSPWFLAVPAFVGCGLFFAGASGWCGMAILLGKMPWNRVASPG
ncbi:rhodanese-like domain-containing protein [Algisphaera agarilytica]|uniref:Rhodanese-related sulfurtransferase n=1 Tax=Algisphaera agarilytica TaxID=1385975 RepID=A0A7X0H3T7_9BACT|nr:rhodanese-like domain-containing protein [Algisphaera agarilytica]MBB6428772.1 rhodanese-related sulfurtransferase [Algisphaera agarilytica]